MLFLGLEVCYERDTGARVVPCSGSVVSANVCLTRLNRDAMRFGPGMYFWCGYG